MLADELGYEDQEEFEDALKADFKTFIGALPHIEVRQTPRSRLPMPSSRLTRCCANSRFLTSCGCVPVHSFIWIPVRKAHVHDAQRRIDGMPVLKPSLCVT